MFSTILGLISSSNLFVLLGAAAAVNVLLLVVRPCSRFADGNYR